MSQVLTPRPPPPFDLYYLLNSHTYIHTHTHIHTVPTPAITIASSPEDTTFFSSLQLNLTCWVVLHAAIDTELGVTLTWDKTGAAINSERVAELGQEIVLRSPFTFKSTLVFSPLSINSDDEGEYRCLAVVGPLENPMFIQNPSPVNTTQQVTIDSKDAMKPLIKDTPKEKKPPNKGHTKCTLVYTL